METITEDYVSFETAKLLKAKGFSENTEHEIWYVVKQFSTGCHWNSCTYKVGDVTREHKEDCCISMPTLLMAMEWLRKEYKIYIPILALEDKGYYFSIIKMLNTQYKQEYLHSSGLEGVFFESYEETAEEAIKYCLENLI